MKLFQWREQDAAIAFAREGGQALHVHRFTMNGHKLFARYWEAGHLFDRNAIRLAATARALGVRVIRIEELGTDRQHVDLCARPLKRAKELCAQPMLKTDREWLKGTAFKRLPS